MLPASLSPCRDASSSRNPVAAGRSRSAAGAEDVRDDLSVSAGADNDNHRCCTPHELRGGRMSWLADAAARRPPGHCQHEESSGPVQASSGRRTGRRARTSLPSSSAFRPLTCARPVIRVGPACRRACSGVYRWRYCVRSGRGSDQAHVTLQHVEQLRQFVDAGTSQQGTEAGHPLSVWQQFRRGAGGAVIVLSLISVNGRPPQPRSLLAPEHRRPRRTLTATAAGAEPALHKPAGRWPPRRRAGACRSSDRVSSHCHAVVGQTAPPRTGPRDSTIRA